jgi:hypothetical protein
MEDVLRISAECLTEFDANHVATAIHKVAQFSKKEGIRPAALRRDARFVSLREAGVERAAEWPPRQLCHAAWSVAVLLMDDGQEHGLLAAVAQAFADHGAVDGVPQDLSTFAWSMAVVQYHNEYVLAKTAEGSLAKICEFGLQDLAIAAWGFAKLLYDGRRPLLTQIAVQSLPKLNDFTGRNLANLVWSFATSSHRDLPLCEALVDTCTIRITELGAQELPIALWSFAAITYPAESVFSSAFDQVVFNFNGMDVSHVCNIAWAYARAGRHIDGLFEALGDEALRRLPYLEPMHLANLHGHLQIFREQMNSAISELVCGMSSSSPALPCEHQCWQRILYPSTTHHCCGLLLRVLSPRTASCWQMLCTSVSVRDFRSTILAMLQACCGPLL